MRGVIVFGICLLLACSHRATTTTEPNESSAASVQIAIDNAPGAFMGHFTEISIGKLSVSEPIKGFRFTIAYPSYALYLNEVRLGGLLTENGWSDLQFDTTSRVEGADSQMVTILRISASTSHADSVGGPTGFCEEPGELVVLRFYVSNNATYLCCLAPIRFVWENCDDNVLSSQDGSHIVSVRHLYEPGHKTDVPFDIAGLETDENASLLYCGPRHGCPGASGTATLQTSTVA